MNPGAEPWSLLAGQPEVALINTAVHVTQQKVRSLVSDVFWRSVWRLMLAILTWAD
jgi:hypothetical protein